MAVNIGVARESAAGERRVALTPETCKKLVAAGATVRIESGIGDGAYFPDQPYVDAGAHVTAHPREGAVIVPSVQPPPARARAAPRSPLPADGGQEAQAFKDARISWRISARSPPPAA